MAFLFSFLISLVKPNSEVVNGILDPNDPGNCEICYDQGKTICLIGDL